MCYPCLGSTPIELPGVVNVHYIPVHTQPYYRALGFAVGNYPEAENYYAEAISLPMYPTLTNKQQDLVVVELRRALTL